MGVSVGVGGCFSRCVEGCGCFSGCGWVFQQVCGRVRVGLSAGVWKSVGVSVGVGGCFSRCVEGCG